MISSIPKPKEKQKNKVKSKKGWTDKDEEEENELSSYFFGTSEKNESDEMKDLNSYSWSYTNNNDEEVEDDEGDEYFIDRKGDGQQLVPYESHGDEENEKSQQQNSTSQQQNKEIVKAVWQDDDEEEVDMLQQSKRKKLRHSQDETIISINEYENRLRTRYNKTQSSFINTDWAKQSKDDDLVLSNTESIFKTDEKVPLPPNQIKTIRHADVNREYHSTNKKSTTVQVVQFYKNKNDESIKLNPLVMTAGLDCMLNFYRINSSNDKEKQVESNKIAGYYFKSFPIHKASFLYDPNVPKVVVSSRRSYLHIYDALSGTIDTIPKLHSRQEKSYENITTSPNGYYIGIIGNDGYVLLLSSQTKRLVSTLKINGSVRSIAFHPTDSNMLFVSGSDSIVYRFDLRNNNKCLDSIENEDGTTIHSLSCYHDYNNELKLAVGSESGVVNLYSLNTKPTLTKSIFNLKTSITKMKPNSNNSILGLSTSYSRDGLRLLHVQSNTVFSNWPSRNTPLSYVFDFDFSVDNKYLCIGNDKGKCLLYEFLHFS